MYREASVFARRRRLAALVYVAAASAALSQTASAQKKPLPIADYERWRSIEGSSISNDGTWVTWTYRNRDALDTKPALHLLNLNTSADREIVNGSQGAFSDDAKWIAYNLELPYAEAKKLRDANKPVPRRVVLMNLATGDTTSWSDIQQFAFAKGSGTLVLRRSAATPPPKHKGTDVLVRDLKTGRDMLLGSVNEYAINKSGELIAFTVDAAQKDANGLFILDLRSGVQVPLDNDAKTYSRLKWDEGGKSLVVLKGSEVEKKVERSNVLVAFPDVATSLSRDNPPKAAILDPATISSFPKDWVLSEKGDVSWSGDGKLLFFGIKPQKDAPDTSVKKKVMDEVADVDIWNTNDKKIISQQIVEAPRDRDFTYRQAFVPRENRYVSLADSTMRDVEISKDGRWAVGSDNRQYVSDWKPPTMDLYRVNTSTGERTLMVKGLMMRTSGGATYAHGISPSGRHYLYWRDGVFKLYDLDNAKEMTLSKKDAGLMDMEFDHTWARPSYGVLGWTKDGNGVILQQRHDAWLYPLDGSAPSNLTQGVGAKNEMKFRYIDIEPEEGVFRFGPAEIDLSKPVLLSATGEWSKKSGFFLLSGGQMKELVYEDAAFGSPQKARNADKVLFTRESFVEFPDLRVSGMDFAGSRKITDANPQQSEYVWGRRMLFEYKDKDGHRLQGVLAIPDDYQQGEKRPMIVTFYERQSQNMHRHLPPTYIGGMGQAIMGAISNGYLYLLPDVRFHTGYSHSDVKNAVEAATKKVIEMGYADPKRIGAHGHSYGGESAAFIGTTSKMFAAVAEGAGVTDLYADFNNPWGWSYQLQNSSSGMNGHDYYISGQGREGVPPWDNPELYHSESAIYRVRETVAPFLLMHGTADGTVPFREAMQFYNALRFNGKTAYLLAYPNEGHGLRGLANRRDLTIRAMQFWDHYLKGAPAPKWMTQGVPFIEKDIKGDPTKW
jgi:dipeptidyl aminopeptidase/acylaminoacyl peptidase